MKTLQDDLTTIEQSKQLLELGVPKNSANHYFGKDGKIHYIDGTIPYSLLWATECIPCWSVGRLIEVLEKSWDSEFPIYCDIVGENDKVLFVIEIIQHFANHSMLDFSKLND